MSNRLDGRTAMVTGAAEGMGRAHAELLAERGARVIVQDIQGRAAEVADAIKAAGGAAEALVCDIADLEATRSGVDAIGWPVDILVNNAGIGQDVSFENITPADFDRMFGVHVRGAFFLTQHLAEGMKARRFGRIINITSIWAQTGFPSAPHYAGAKGAMAAMTKSWAKELAPYNILVNAVSPGLVLTSMTLAKAGLALVEERKSRTIINRYALPIEIAYTVAMLASPEGDFYTGQVLSPNGGETIVGI